MANPHKVRPQAMILENNVEDAQRYQALLNRMGVDVALWNQTGTGWVDDFNQKKPDIAIVGMTLPKRDGISSIEKITDLHAGCRILMVHSYSGQMANNVELDALGLGAISVLQKPFKDERFLVSLERIISTDPFGRNSNLFDRLAAIQLKSK